MPSPQELLLPLTLFSDEVCEVFFSQEPLQASALPWVEAWTISFSQEPPLFWATFPKALTLAVNMVNSIALHSMAQCFNTQ